MSNKPLTKVQQKIVGMISEGQTKVGIAKKLGLSRQMIYEHLKRPEVVEAISSVQRNVEAAKAKAEQPQAASAVEIAEIQTRHLTHDETVFLAREDSVQILRSALWSEDVRMSDKIKISNLFESKHQAALKADKTERKVEQQAENIHTRSSIIIDSETGKKIDLSMLTDEELEQRYQRDVQKQLDKDRKIRYLTETDPIKKDLAGLNDDEFRDVYIEKLANPDDEVDDKIDNQEPSAHQQSDKIINDQPTRATSPFDDCERMWWELPRR